MTVANGSGQAKNTFAWLVYALLSLWLSIAVAWWVYARFDYGYGFWYQALDIREHIARYAPANAGRPGFAGLPEGEHRRLFREIRLAVHAGGDGLAGIDFSAPGEPVRPVLDDAEVTHLRDVALLLDRGLLASLLLVPVWLLAARRRARSSLPSWRVRLAWSALFVAVVLLPLVVAGPRDVFYAFHEWLFPPEHQWFFYWEESLMSTLMKAPYLFGGIAAVIAGAGLALAPLIYAGGIWVVRRPGRR